MVTAWGQLPACSWFLAAGKGRVPGGSWCSASRCPACSRAARMHVGLPGQAAVPVLGMGAGGGCTGAQDVPGCCMQDAGCNPSMLLDAGGLGAAMVGCGQGTLRHFWGDKLFAGWVGVTGSGDS